MKEKVQVKEKNMLKQNKRNNINSIGGNNNNTCDISDNKYKYGI